MTTRGTMALVCLCVLSAGLLAMTRSGSSRTAVRFKHRASVPTGELIAGDLREREASGQRTGPFPDVEGPRIAGPPPGHLPWLKRAAPLIANPARTAALRELIRREMPRASAAEIDVWVNKLRGMPLHSARDLLAIRQMFPLKPRGDDPLPLNTQPDPEPRMPFVIGPNPPRLTPVPPSEPSPLDASFAALKVARNMILANLANANTPGFKRCRAVVGESGRAGSVSDRSEVRTVTVQRDWSQGKLVKTGRALDFAIKGDGFFVVRRDQQRAFTRCGNFERDSHGGLVLATDRSWRVAIAPEPGELRQPAGSANGMPQNKLTLSLAVHTARRKHANGRRGLSLPVLPGALAAFARVGMQVDIQRAKQRPPRPAAELIHDVRLATFPNPDGLRPLGNGLFAATPSSGPAAIGDAHTEGFGRIGSGFLEASNVDLQRELAELRTFAAQIQALRTAEDVLKDAETPSRSRGPLVDQPEPRRMSRHRSPQPKSNDESGDEWFDRLFHSEKYREINRNLNYLPVEPETPSVPNIKSPRPMVPPRAQRQQRDAVIPATFDQPGRWEFPIEIEILFFRKTSADRSAG